MLRHFFQSPRQRFAPEIGFLPFGVIQASLHGLLVITVVLTAFPSPGLPPASLAAVTLTSLAFAADKEHFATKRAKRSPEYKL